MKHEEILTQVSDLKFDDESMRLIVRSLALECHNSARFGGILSHSVEAQLPLIFSVLESNLGDLLDIRNVAAGDTSCIAGFSVTFSNEGYRRIASAAKDRVTNVVYGNANII